MRARHALKAAIVTAVLVAAARDARGEPEPIHLKSSSHVVTAKGSELDLPPGYFLPEPTYTALDVELRRLQDAETKLAAENASLRASASAGAPWWAIAAAVAVGAAGGAYAWERWGP